MQGRTIVFCNSIDCVRRLVNLFSLVGVKPLPLHAQLHQKQRLKNLDRYGLYFYNQEKREFIY